MVLIPSLAELVPSWQAVISLHLPGLSALTHPLSIPTPWMATVQQFRFGFMSQAGALGVPPTKAYKAAYDLNLSYRRQDWLQDYRQHYYPTETATFVSLLEGDFLLDWREFEYEGFEMPSREWVDENNYSYVFEVQYTSAAGAIRYDYVTVKAVEPMRMAEARELVEDEWAKPPEGETRGMARRKVSPARWDITGISLVQAWHKVGAER